MNYRKNFVFHKLLNLNLAVLLVLNLFNWVIMNFVDDCFTGELKPINNMMFSTWDYDNDVALSHCAELYKSGWWHGNYHCTNPNGLYLRGENTATAQGIKYESWRSQDYSLKYVHLMVRRTD